MTDAGYTLSSAPNEPADTPRKKRSLLKVSLIATALLFGYALYQCGTGLYKTSRQGTAAVQDFHAMLNAEQYERIYDEASEEFQQSGQKEELTGFLKAVHEKLGDAGETHMRNINVTTDTSGTRATGTYETTFKSGAAVETFTWRISGGKLRLLGYNINSRQLIMK